MVPSPKAKDEDPTAVLSRFAPDRPFTVTPAMTRGLTPQQTSILYEESLYRKSLIRMAMRCPVHVTRTCAHCMGSGMYKGDDERMRRALNGKCPPCDGLGRVPWQPPATWACAHCYPQDEKHPDGIVFTPKRYYVCRTCWRLIEEHKFNFRTEIMTKCWQCINDEGQRIRQIDPGLLIDYSVKQQ